MPHYEDDKKDKRKKLMEKVKMYDVSDKLDLPGKDKSEKTYPTIRLTDDQLHGVKTKEVGEKCEFLVTAKVASKREDDDEVSVSLDVEEMGYVK